MRERASAPNSPLLSRHSSPLLNPALIDQVTVGGGAIIPVTEDEASQHHRRSSSQSTLVVLEPPPHQPPTSDDLANPTSVDGPPLPTEAQATAAAAASTGSRRNWLGMKAGPYLIIPPLFFHVLAVTLGAGPLNQFLILIVCDMLGGKGAGGAGAGDARGGLGNTTFAMFTDSRLMGHAADVGGAMGFPDYYQCAKRDDVQAQSAAWSQIIHLANAVPSFIIAPMVGYFVDGWGRQTVMMVPILSSILGYVATIVVAQYNYSLWLLVFTNLLQGMMGGYAALITCVYAYLADTSDSATRTQKFFFTDAFTFSAFTIGPYLGGLASKELGLLPVFYITISIEVVVFAYVALILPESLRRRKEPAAEASGVTTNADGAPTSATVAEDPTKKPKTAFSIFIGAWKTVLAVLAAPGRGASVRILAIVTAVAAMVYAGYQYVFYYYTAKMFGWDPYEYGLFSLTNSVCRLFYLVVLLPWVFKTFMAGRNSVAKIRLELMVVRIGMLFYVCGFFAFGLATEGWMFFVIAILDGFGIVALPTVRALLSKTAPNSRQGRLFAALEMLQAGAGLLSQMLIPLIYRATIGGSVPGTICFVISGVWAGALALTAWVKSRELVSLTSEEDREGLEEEDEEVGGAGGADVEARGASGSQGAAAEDDEEEDEAGAERRPLLSQRRGKAPLTGRGEASASAGPSEAEKRMAEEVAEVEEVLREEATEQGI
ncbi:hypothetical protein HK101_009976 [Irineochytrium annulatum]|nr:hypothetical protein HK101_009976 [Irineochytrium annulatum]